MANRDIIYDIEVYPNVFCATFLEVRTMKIVVFEISEFKDQWVEFQNFLKVCSNNFVRHVGFNNLAYDYQVIHRMLGQKGRLPHETMYEFTYRINQALFAMTKEEKHEYMIWPSDHVVPQVDLYKIHHFDNDARRTSLKKLEFNMRSKTIQDLPYPPGTILTKDQVAELIKYNLHDVMETFKFYKASADMIAFREELTEKYGKNFINHNDTKIGKDYFIMELEAAGIQCFKKRNGEKVPVQTLRPYIDMKDVIYDYIEFERPEFNAVMDWLKRQRITQTKGVFLEIDVRTLGSLKQYVGESSIQYGIRSKKGKLTFRGIKSYKHFPDAVITVSEKIEFLEQDENIEAVRISNLNCVVNGFQFDFGTGGIHGSVPATVVISDEGSAVVDYDVTSLYPSIAIVNRNFPEHLTEKFCEIYAAVKKDRMSYAKGTPENAMLKLALNGVYGDSNNPFSCFFDPKYTMTITINGQLMLCMLAEMMMDVEGLSLIQVNTDGVTVKVAHERVDEVEKINVIWENLTGLNLERADYDKMYIRDVNNYIGLYTDGQMKRKGAYEYELGWEKNHSSLVIQKAVEANLVRGENITHFINAHKAEMDFMLRTNIPSTSRLMLDSGYDERTGMADVEALQRTTRYYMCKEGGQLTKIMPPLHTTVSFISQREKARTPAQIRKFDQLAARRERLGVADRERMMNVESECMATPCNTMIDESIRYIDYDWYIKKAHELVDPLWSGAFRNLLE